MKRKLEKTERVGLVMEPELRALVERAAARDDRTLSEWARRALRDKAKEQLGDQA